MDNKAHPWSTHLYITDATPFYPVSGSRMSLVHDTHSTPTTHSLYPPVHPRPIAAPAHSSAIPYSTSDAIPSLLQSSHLVSGLPDDISVSPMSFKTLAFPMSPHAHSFLDSRAKARTLLKSTGENGNITDESIPEIKCCGKIFKSLQVLSGHYEACHLPTAGNLSGTIDSIFNHQEPITNEDKCHEADLFTPSTEEDIQYLLESNPTGTAAKPLDIFPTKTNILECAENNVDAELSLLLDNAVGLEQQELDFNTKRRLSVAAFSIGSYVADMKRQREEYRAQREKEKSSLSLNVVLPEDLVDTSNSTVLQAPLNLSPQEALPPVVALDGSAAPFVSTDVTGISANTLMPPHLLDLNAGLTLDFTHPELNAVTPYQSSVGPIPSLLNHTELPPSVYAPSTAYALPSHLSNLSADQLLSSMNLNAHLSDLTSPPRHASPHHPHSQTLEPPLVKEPLTSPSMLSRHLASMKKDDQDQIPLDTTPSASSSISDFVSITMKQFACPHEECGKRYKNRNGLKYHLAMVHGQKQASVPMYSLHLVHTGKQPAPEPQLIPMGEPLPFICCVAGCGKKYRNLGGLKYHLSHVHPDIPFESTLNDIKKKREAEMTQQSEKPHNSSHPLKPLDSTTPSSPHSTNNVIEWIDHLSNNHLDAFLKSDAVHKLVQKNNE